MKKASFLPVISATVLLGAAMLASSGCNTGNTPRDLMAEEAHTKTGVERPIAMRGEGTYMEGKIVAYATISRGFDRGKNSERANKGGKYREAPPESWGFGDSEEDQKQAMEAYMRLISTMRAQGSPMPPVTLRVYVDNKSTEPMQVEVLEVNSSLGNFAARPDHITVAPGERGELDPMISQLGVTSDEIPLKLGIRAGGKQETQVITVKNVIKDSVMK